MRVASYARYSTEKQSESSITDQLRLCDEYAARHGWIVVSRFTDEGISGAAFGNRPGAIALEQFALAGECDVILAVDLTRLSRSSGDLSKFLDRMRFRKVRVLGVQDGYDSHSRTARMQAGMSGIMSEEFRAMIADRTRAALSIRAEQGQSTGGKAYGYEGNEGAIVAEIFERFAAGESMKAIASDLNRRGIPSPGAGWKRDRRAQHGRWLVSALNAMLQNERYAGRLIYNRSQWHKDPDTGKRVRTERPQHEWVIQEIPPLVDPEVWAACQTRFKPGRGRGGAPRYLLSGLLECALCGSKFIVVGGSQRRYVCGTYHAGGEHACSNRLSVPKSIAEEKILQPVLDDLLSPAARVEALKEMRKAAAENAPSPDPQIERLEQMVREGLLSPEIAAPALAEARRRSKASTVVMLPTEREWRETVASMREILEGEDVSAARETLKEILGPIRLRPAETHMIAALTAREILLQTGTGRWVGSGGPLLIYIPISSRPSAQRGRTI
jgi:DNA invertase Pin-like site-specific DNA recombinase